MKMEIRLTKIGLFSELRNIGRVYRNLLRINGGVVQLVRTSACHAEGREFESRRSRHFYNAVMGQRFLFIRRYWDLR